MAKIALMGHIVASYPNLDSSLKAAVGIISGGAEYLEVQFPFSDPNADGETIANANAAALRDGFNTDSGFLFIKKLKKILDKEGLEAKLLIMTYGNILFNYGIKEFLLEAKKASVWGLIVPDLSIQNDECLFKLARKYGLQNIALIAPNTPLKRIKQLCNTSGEIVYAVARAGITGDKTIISNEILEYIKSIKEITKKPIALGFGIQSKEQIQALKGVVEIAVVGSAFVRKITDLTATNGDFTKELECYTKELLG
ncbi:MAG: tryptophan synthase subunit alpha [Helicobacter sp.]|nr:tryptophan synthase subunit alpha [Helicobacteraceae bacterium]MDY3112805.1 tryptophan synthase subunit alpha [Helicobacter sp.]